MDALEIVKADSGAWSAEYGLPLVPACRNPWLYMAYACKLLELNGALIDFNVSLQDFIKRCEIAPGLFHRYPDGDRDITSFDEIMGIAYLDKLAAGRVFKYLEEHFGEYNNTGEQEKVPEQFNVYRFLFLRPFLKAITGSFDLLAELIWSGVIFWDAFTYDKSKGLDASGRLRTWLMMEDMEVYLLCRLAIKFWRYRMKRQEVTLKECMAIEPREAPSFAAIVGNHNF
jgi:hypothetical protein